MLIHLDTDLGGDPDDACALAYLLGRADAELVGITTTIDPDGMRAAQVRHVLELARRTGVPVAAGARRELTSGREVGPRTGPPYWPDGLVAAPSPPGAASELLLRGIERGATIVAIGPLTNLAELELAHPGSLARVPVVAMGGWVTPPAPGLPPHGPQDDWNVQWDTRAAEIVAAAATDLALATLPATMRAHLTGRDLPRLRASGPVGELLARQGDAHSRDHGMVDLPPRFGGLPRDLLNFHYDPVACAVALESPACRVTTLRLAGACGEDGVFRWPIDPAGRPARVLLDVDDAAFREEWIAAVEAADRAAGAA
jgi:purine nucleosidase